MGDWQIFFIPKAWWEEIHDAGAKGDYPAHCIFELSPLLYKDLIDEIKSYSDPNCIRHIGIYAVEKDSAKAFQDWFQNHFVFRPCYKGEVKPDLSFIRSPSNFLNTE